MLTHVKTAGHLLVGLLLLVTPVAVAGISNVIFSIDASNSGGSTSFQVTSDQLVPDPGTGGYKWILPSAQELWADPSNLVATLNYATLTVVDTWSYPRIIMNYEILAGESNGTFMVKSPLVSFPTIPGVVSKGRATVGYTLSDFSDGIPAKLEGLDPGAGLGIFTAQYNGFVPNGTEFANLIEQLATDNGGTLTATAAQPPVGTWLNIGVDVYDSSVSHGFTLTANDLMSGTNTFVVTPEPAAFGLMALGVVGLSLRRR